MTREELNAVKDYVSSIQAIKDAHNTDKLLINYGTICAITLNGWKLLEGLKKSDWIPVSERLPDPQKDGDKDYSDWLQVTIDIGRNGNSDTYVCEAYYCFSENKWYTKRFVVGIVTAWRPLPEPYKV